MKKFAVVAVSLAASLAVLASPSAFAQGKTRAEVYQELIEAQQNGLNYVTETSYPDVNPVFAAKVAQLKRDNTASASTAPKGSSVAGMHTAMNAVGNPSCARGTSVCNIYFGA